MDYLVRDNNLVPTTSFDGDVEFMDGDAGEGYELDDEVTPTGYGARGGYGEYYYTIDRKQRRLIISGSNAASSTLILRYISSGINTTTETEIPLYAEEALESYIRWKESDYDEARADVTYQKKLIYDRAIRRMKKVHAPALQDIKNAIYQSANQSIRR
jgi:hypothetical protein